MSTFAALAALVLGLCAGTAAGERAKVGGRFMDCGSTSLCGVLTVESGFGTGYYQHPAPAVHGLWPETGTYGSSSCISPTDTTPPATLFPCYKGGDPSHQLDFEQHEWSKHGVCAAGQNATEFFQQVCALAQAPLAVMSKTRASGVTNTTLFAKALSDAGYPVWDTMDNGQVELSACARADGTWVLGPVAAFPKLCGGGPVPPPTPPGGQCVPSKHGPPCAADSDCVNKTGCVRCAHSGFCTNDP